jgi:hypothetical protein
MARKEHCLLVRDITASFVTLPCCTCWVGNSWVAEMTLMTHMTRQLARTNWHIICSENPGDGFRKRIRRNAPW